MAFATGSDPLVAGALWVGVAALGLAVALVAAVAILRLRLATRLAHERRFAALWQPLLAACSERVPARLPALERGDSVQFLHLWIHALEAMAGDTRQRLVELARRIGADRYAAEALASGDRRRELLALAALGHLGMPSTLPLAESLLESKSAVISMVAAQALLRIDPGRSIARVARIAAQRADWPVSKVAALLAECGAERAGKALVEEIEGALGRPSHAARLVRLLHMLGMVNADGARPTVLRALESADSADSVAAALDALRHPEDAAWARACATHAEWFVRVAAAKALARLGVAQDRGLLAGMLTDASWWVRYRSAQALARLPGMTREELLRLRDSATDRYAADMLAQVISEQGAG